MEYVVEYVAEYVVEYAVEYVVEYAVVYVVEYVVEYVVGGGRRWVWLSPPNPPLPGSTLVTPWIEKCYPFANLSPTLRQPFAVFRGTGGRGRLRDWLENRYNACGSSFAVQA